MAGVLSRFSSATATIIQQLKNSSINENTVKSPAFWLLVWKKWCLEKEIAAKIENYEPTQFNSLLERFYAEIKNKHGEDYEPESLKVMITSLDRHLKNKDYKLSIVRDREFSSTKQVLDGKAKQLRNSLSWSRQAPKQSSTTIRRGRRNSLEERETRW